MTKKILVGLVLVAVLFGAVQGVSAQAAKGK